MVRKVRLFFKDSSTYLGSYYSTYEPSKTLRINRPGVCIVETNPLPLRYSEAKGAVWGKRRGEPVTTHLVYAQFKPRLI